MSQFLHYGDAALTENKILLISQKIKDFMGKMKLSNTPQRREKFIQTNKYTKK